jgi:transcriptional regulator with XRE-family HTH domain
MRYIVAVTTDARLAWTLSDRLRKGREVAELSRDDLAEYLGLSRQAISNYELGHRVPKLAILRLWAMRTGVPLDWLRFGDQGFSGDPGGASASTKWKAHGGQACPQDRHLVAA